MKSWLLDATMELVHSHDEGDASVYTVILKFKDLFGNDRTHFATTEFSKPGNLHTRVSFTAMSSISTKLALVESVMDGKVRVMFSDRTVDASNPYSFQVKRGQLVYLIEHLDVVANDGTLCEVVIPYEIPFSPEALCLQTVNADLLDDAGNLLYRLSADSLPGGCYGARVAT